MAWVLQMLGSGDLPTTSGVLVSPQYPCVVRGIRVSNLSGVSVTCTIYASTAGGDVPLTTPDLPLTVNESVLVDTPIMLAGGVDGIKGVGSTSSGISYTIWGVVKQ